MKKLIASALLVTSSVMAGTLSGIPDYENPRSLSEGRGYVTSLNEVARLNLTSGSTTLDLWSGSYWPLYNGLIGARYRDPEFTPMIEKAQYDKFKELTNALPVYTYSGRENLLSPAEKYDLIVGDPLMSLTKYSWDLGEKNQIGGKVKLWRGLCDGWASAAMKMPRPVRAVTMKTPTGTPITFYPEDIKALGSLLYARNQGAPIFLGKRCYSQVLGVFTGTCGGTNAGALHLALVNRVGLLKNTFIADVSPGTEVWNYPVKSYEITYYNVFDDEESKDFNKVKEPFDKKLKFGKKGSRHKETAFIVGVKLKVTYADMRPATTEEINGRSHDKDMSKTYNYDLELDRNNNVIGGESWSKNLPDFMWAPNDRTYPLADAEKNSLGMDLVKMSQTAATRGQPLASIIERLFEAAK